MTTLVTFNFPNAIVEIRRNEQKEGYLLVFEYKTQKFTATYNITEDEWFRLQDILDDGVLESTPFYDGGVLDFFTTGMFTKDFFKI